MAAPKKHDDPLEGILSEALSAISALHMPPKSIPLEENDPAVFLADTDEWCKHAVEHMNAVIDHCWVAMKHKSHNSI